MRNPYDGLRKNQGDVPHHESSSRLPDAARKYRVRQVEKEEALYELHAHVEAYLEHLNVVWVVLDPKGIITFVNRKTCELLEYQKEDLIGKNWFDLCIPKTMRKQVKAVFEHIMASKLKEAEFFENAVITKSGKERIIAWTNAYLFDQQYNIIGSVSFGSDVTEKKDMEDALQKSDAKFSMLLEQFKVPMFIYRGVKFLYVNHLFEELTGFKGEELLGMHFWEVIHPDFRDIVKDRGMKRQSGADVPARYEVKIVRKNKEECWVDFIATTIEIMGEVAVLVIMNDITEKKRSAEQMERVNQLIKVSRHINKILLTATQERDLFEPICKTLIEVKGIDFVWVGLVQKNNCEVHPIAHAGDQWGYLLSLKVRWDNSEYGNGPVGIAIKSAQPCVINDIQDNRYYLPWREAAVNSGYKASASFPFVCGTEVVGSLNVYTKDQAGFEDQTHAFLEQIALDVALRINGLRGQ